MYICQVLSLAQFSHMMSVSKWMFETPFEIVNNEISYYSMQSDTEILSLGGRLFQSFSEFRACKYGLRLLSFFNLHFFFYLQQHLQPWYSAACIIGKRNVTCVDSFVCVLMGVCV